MHNRIELLKSYPTHYRMIDDDVLEEVVVSLRRNRNDGKKYLRLVNEYRRWTRHRGKVIQVAWDGTMQKTEMEKIRIRKDQSVDDVIDTLDKVVQMTLDQFEYGDEPPTWFKQYLWDRGLSG